MIELVPPTADHLDAIVGIEQAAFAGRQPWSRAAFAAELRMPQSLWRVALDGGTVAGYGGGWVTPDGFHLLNLATHPARLRRGIARKLLVELFRLSHAAGAIRTTLEVRPENLPAVRLYESAGFRSLGLRPAFYPDGGAALLMEKRS